MKPARLRVGWLLTVTACLAHADQPIMNEVPRWNGGYGAQVFQEFRWSSDLLRGGTAVPNPEKLRYEKRITHLEGIYTWHKSIRVTAKLPWVQQKRRVMDADGATRWERGTGLDDARLALPLRRYVNQPHYSGHLGVVPQVRFGGDDGGAFPISDGSTDYGFSVTYERETSGIKISADLSYWWEQASGEDDEWSIDIEIGWNFHDRGAINWETEYIEESDGSEWLGGGPTFFWNFNDVILGRIEYKFALDERVRGTDLAQGDALRIGLGAVF
jgi:hypothetical protein